MLILVEGNRYRSYLNGVEMIDFTYPSPNLDRGSNRPATALGRRRTHAF